MKYLFAFLVGFIMGLSRELWWKWAVKAVEWFVREVSK